MFERPSKIAKEGDRKQLPQNTPFPSLENLLSFISAPSKLDKIAPTT